MSSLNKTYVSILTSKPNLTDDELHRLAEENNVVHEKVEEFAYKVAYLFLKEFMMSGESKGIELPNTDQDELFRGIEVELEHTVDKVISKKIALDHLREDPKYYTHLDEMERKYSGESH